MSHHQLSAYILTTQFHQFYIYTIHMYVICIYVGDNVSPTHYWMGLLCDKETFKLEV